MVTREALTGALLDYALLLRDKPEWETTLWACVRRSASMISVGGVDDFTEFLRPEDAKATHQVALQAIQSIFQVEKPLVGPSKLRDRLHEMIPTHIDPACQTAEDRALAFNFYGALASVGSDRIDEATRRIRLFGSLYVARRCLEILQAIRVPRPDLAHAIERLQP